MAIRIPIRATIQKVKDTVKKVAGNQPSILQTVAQQKGITQAQQQKPVQLKQSNPTLPVKAPGLTPEQIQRAQLITESQKNNPGYLKDAGKKAYDMAKTTAQALPRAAVSASMGVTGEQERTPTGPIERKLLGSEPIKPIAQRVADNEMTLKDMGVKHGALPLAFAGTVAATAADLLPGNPLKATEKKGAGSVISYINSRNEKVFTSLTEDELRVLRNETKNIPTAKGASQIHLDADTPQLRQAGKQISREEFAAGHPQAAQVFENAQKQARYIKDDIGKFKGSKAAVPLETNPEAGFIKVPGREDIRQGTQKFRAAMVDDLAPLHDMTAGKVATDADPYTQARLFAGRGGKIENRLDDLGSIIKSHSDYKQGVEYATLERYDELAKRGVTDFPDGLNAEAIASKKAALETPENKAFAQQLYKYSDNLLKEAKDAGILSDAQYAGIKAKNEKYVPLHRMEYLAEQADNLPAGSKSFSVNNQDIVRSIKGSTKDIRDPLQSIISNTHRTVNLIERNKVALKVADLAGNPQFKGVVEKLTGELPSGMEKFSVFRNGVKEEYAVPKNVGEALKGMNKQETDMVTTWVNKVSTAPLRAGATGLNVAFILPNAVRDAQTATMVSKVGFTPVDWVKGFAEAIRKGDDFKAFREAGGSMSGYFESQRALPKTVKQLRQGKLVKAGKIIINPLELIRKASEVIELAPRLGVFKRSVRKGTSELEAAFNARNATTDFSKAGSTMRVVNKWVPFLNARVQGTVNTFNAIKNRPVRSAMVMSTMVGAPVVATYFYNTRNHKDIWDDISQTEKDNYFMVIYGDKKDAQGNPTQVIKMPKGDIGKIFGNPLENFLASMDSADSKQLDELALQSLSDASPIDFARDGKLSGNAVMSGVVPPLGKAAVEWNTNKNLYTGRDIVPRNLQNVSPREQYNDKTSPVAKFIGDKLNVSPMKLDNTAGTQFGGLGRQVMNPGKAGGTVTSRFMGARGGETLNKQFDTLDAIEQQAADKSLSDKRKAQSLYDGIKSLPAEQRVAKLKGEYNAGRIDETTIAKLKDILLDEQKNRSTFERVLAEKPVAVRASYLKAELDKLSSPEEKKQLILDLYQKKVVTEAVLAQLKKLYQP